MIPPKIMGFGGSLGMLIAAGAGYLTYKAGYRMGKKEREKNTEETKPANRPNVIDETLKDAMKAYYKSKDAVIQAFDEEKTYFRNLVNQAKKEVNKNG